MAADDRNDPSLRTDAAFERWLLDSAKSDGPAEGAAEASWSQFVKAAGAALPPDAPRLEREGAVTTGNAAALQWLAIGALGGALVTATWLGAPTRRDAPVPSERPTLATAPVANVEPAPAAEHAMTGPGVAPSEPPSAVAPRTRPRLQPAPRARRSIGATALPAQPPILALQEEPTSPSAPASTLEREVAMLDAVRNALTGADFDGALQLIAEYRRQFPRGELARDADVFEVEAFARRGDRARARRAAQRFLREYPRDPHAGRLRALVDIEPE
jgi:hypothetical protein